VGKPRTLSLFASKKRKREPIVLMTAYDLATARIAADAGVDALLVGDSLGMVVLGHETTLPVTLEDVLHHARAVARARPGVPVIADLPYGSFHVSPEQTVAAAVRLVKEADVCAVKLEGGRKRTAVIEALLAAEIPVMGHLGLTPQSIHRFGGYKLQGRGRGAAEVLIEEARFLDEIGCFAMVLECIPRELAACVTREVRIPTIGIGAGPDCDGQVLVFHDLVGLLPGPNARFAPRYAELAEVGEAAVRRWSDDVRAGRFPTDEHSYTSGETPSGAAAASAPAQDDGASSPNRGEPSGEGSLAPARDEEV
jgi:3-methyl-2-oxobutanoate hydroxymethyltransferase